MGKFYFAEHDESCFTLDYHRQEMKDQGITELVLYQAKRESGTGMFFCLEHQEVGEVGESCDGCGQYVPNNGKNGRCKHYGYVYDRTDKKITLRLPENAELTNLKTDNE